VDINKQRYRNLPNP